MHELSMCESIADTVRAHADGREVRRVVVSIGHLRQAVPETLRFCWGLVVAGSPLAACELVVDDIAAMVTCRSCGASSTLDQPVLQCAACGSVDTVLTAGDEFMVESIDVVNTEAASR